MAQKPDVWMPLYIAKYIQDTQHLNTEEHGAYLLILMHAWTNSGKLPADPERLRVIAKMESKNWRRSWPVISEFIPVHGDSRRNKRIDAELRKAHAMVEQRVEAGKASAERRWGKRESNDGDNETGNEPINGGGNETGNEVVTESLRENTPSHKNTITGLPTPEPVPPPQPVQKKRARPMKSVAVLPSWLPSGPWASYLEMRKKKNKPMTEKAVELVHKKLAGLRVDGEDLSAVLLQSVENGWTGVFPVKHGGQRGLNVNDANRQAAQEWLNTEPPVLEGEFTRE